MGGVSAVIQLAMHGEKNRNLDDWIIARLSPLAMGFAGRVRMKHGEEAAVWSPGTPRSERGMLGSGGQPPSGELCCPLQFHGLRLQ